MTDDLTERLKLAAKYLRVRLEHGRDNSDVNNRVWAKMLEDAAREIAELRKQKVGAAA